MGLAVRRWSGAVFVIALVALAATGCGDDSERAGGTTVAANSAAEATRAANSFRVAITGRMFETDKPIQESHGEGVVDLHAGVSRLALTQMHESGPQHFEQVVIGPDQWVKFPTDVIASPKPWTHFRSRSNRAPIPDPALLVSYLEQDGALLRSAERETVRGVSTTHSAVDLSEKSSGFELDVWVDDDNLIRRMRMTIRSPGEPEQAVESTVEFFDFGIDVTVDPPPADQVQEVDECGMVTPPTTTELEFSCDPPAEASSPKLPEPRVTTRSGLQFRPVRSIGGTCEKADKNPPAGEPATLADSEGQCYSLRAAGLTVSSADLEAHAGEGGEVVVRFTVKDADADRLDDIAAETVGKQLAMVMFGRVLSAPTVQQAEFGGEGQIGPVDPQTAADIIAALSG